MWTYNTWIVLLGTSLLGASAGLVGSFAVLRGRSLTGDALSHAALPGLCIAFLITGQRQLPALLAGAFCSGLLGIAVISALRRWTRIREDAAIGIVLSVFFGAGVALSRLIQDSSATPESFILGKTAGMVRQDVYWIAGLALACLLVTMLLYKEFKLVVFDADFARVQGWPDWTLDLLLMLLIATTVVIGLPAVGVLLMAALLILPGATARFWTDRLEILLALASGFGLLIGLVGTLVSARYSQLPTGPMIVLVGSLLFFVSLLVAPQRGLFARWRQEWLYQQQLLQDRLLLRVYENGYAEQASPQPSTVIELPLLSREWGINPLRLRWTARTLRQQGLLTESPTRRLVLTNSGTTAAQERSESQRQWESALLHNPSLANQFSPHDPRLRDQLWGTDDSSSE